MSLKGKVALLVGAGRKGIGQAYCEALLERGAKVCFGDILESAGKESESRLQKKYGEDNVKFILCDVRKKEDMEHLCETTKKIFGRIDIGNYNAAVINEFDFTGPLDINVGGLIRFTEALLRVMGRDNGGDGGVVVNTASVSSLYPDDWGPVYCATKHAVLAYTRAWAMPLNFAKHGVRFNTVCPGDVATSFPEDFCKSGIIRHYEEKLSSIGSKANESVPTEMVAQQFIKLIEDDSLNGMAIEIATKDKIRMIPTPKRDF